MTNTAQNYVKSHSKLSLKTIISIVAFLFQFAIFGKFIIFEEFLQPKMDNYYK
jgi:hypothetical protein